MGNILEMFTSIQGEGQYIGTPSIFIRFVGCNLKCDWCFVGNTYISTPIKKVKIKNLKVGDNILSYNLQRERVEVDKVKRCMSRNVDEVYAILFRDGHNPNDILYCTDNHSFFVKGKWIMVCDLKVGDEIYQLDFQPHMIFNNPMKNPVIAKGNGKKISIKLKGRKYSNEHKEKIKRAKQLNPTRNFREHNGNWKGGINQHKYSHHHNEWLKLKQIVFERDNHVCQIAGCLNQNDLVVHHIDHDVTHNSIYNLLTLCRSHNSSINHNRYIPNFKVTNGRTIIDIKKINIYNNRHAYVRLAELIDNKIKVYNIETEKNNNYFVPRVLAHNCDTKYSWVEEGKYNVDDAIRFIEKNIFYNHLVLTGGEPLLHQNDIIKIHHAIHKMKKDIIVTIETNGTIQPDFELGLWHQNHLIHDNLWSVSPKLQFMDKHPENTLIDENYNLSTLKWFDNCKNIQWKFVINNLQEDIDKISNLILSDTITKFPIIVQPNGLKTDYNEACRELVEYIIKNNLTQVRVLPQFHKICWGNKRGV